MFQILNSIKFSQHVQSEAILKSKFLSIENNPQIQMPYRHSDARWESLHLK